LDTEVNQLDFAVRTSKDQRSRSQVMDAFKQVLWEAFSFLSPECMDIYNETYYITPLHIHVTLTFSRSWVNQRSGHRQHLPKKHFSGRV